MSLPVLALSGVPYAIKLREAGMPAVLVVEKPDDYAGKQFRFAEGDGFRALSLGKAHGPFRDLMALPPNALRGLDCDRLREIGQSRELYLVDLIESVQLQEEDDEPESEGGVHRHELDRKTGRALKGDQGWHRHLFFIEKELELRDGSILPAGTLIVTERDGGHPHKIAENGNATEKDGPHAHVVIILLPNGGEIRTKTDTSGTHAHILLVTITGLDGLHKHQIVIGMRTLTSLSPSEFFALESEGIQAAAQREIATKIVEEIDKAVASGRSAR